MQFFFGAHDTAQNHKYQEDQHQVQVHPGDVAVHDKLKHGKVLEATATGGR